MKNEHCRCQPQFGARNIHQTSPSSKFSRVSICTRTRREMMFQRAWYRAVCEQSAASRDGAENSP